MLTLTPSRARTRGKRISSSVSVRGLTRWYPRTTEIMAAIGSDAPKRA